MSENDVAERAAATERAISEADAWELRYAQEVAANRGLRSALLVAQETNSALHRRVMELENGQIEADRLVLFARLDLQDGDELVLRDGKPLLLRAPEKSGLSSMETGTMDPPGGVPAEPDSEESVGGE